MGAAAIGLAGFLHAPGFVLASPLHFECAAEQKLVGRALVCEYFMLGRLNAQLADLHDRIVRTGRAGRVEVKRWLAARDACRDVECLDRLFEAGIREAKIALVDVENRPIVPMLTNARGVVLRVMEPAPAAVALERSVREAPPPARSSRAGYVALLVLGVAVPYVLLARRAMSA